MAGKRLDVLLVENGLCESRERAKTLIMSGDVYVNDQKSVKPGVLFKEDVKLEVRAPKMEFVSRGGYKLKKAMEEFSITLDGKVCMDIGASTGGFTDCMLQRGAKLVYAIDVGYGQLAWKLRNDERVVVMERTNIRGVEPEMLSSVPDFCSIDVSFISLRLVLPVAAKLLSPEGEAVCLIKPQFEAGREKVGKKGVVRDPAVHLEVLNAFLQTAAENGFVVSGLSWSPIRGPEGNIEYLGYLTRSGEASYSDPKEIVDASHRELSES